MELTPLIKAMIHYNGPDPRRTQHFIKVYAFAKTIGEAEALDKKNQEILEVAAVVHDIGIKISEEKYGKSTGKTQEKEGPVEAEKLLEDLGYDVTLIQRVCFLVGHHHNYHQIAGMDYQILVEADFLVNIYEDQLEQKAIEKIRKNIFKTKTGIGILDSMYLYEPGSNEEEKI